MRSLSHSVLLLAALCLPACAYVSQSAYENALCKLDEDGDGDPRCGISNTTADGDCDDDNSLMFNGATEDGLNAYDGFDNDCRGGDLIDVDGDGYPGISREDYEAAGFKWPEGHEEALDCHDLPIEGHDDVDPADVNPGAAETWYNGVDNDCSGGSDYDQDGDGQESDDYRGIGEGVTTDCDDADAEVKKRDGGDTGEPYDGVDQDCSELNDYDPDGDGYLTTGYDASARIYVQKYGWELTWQVDSDCFDVGDTLDGADSSGKKAEDFHQRCTADETTGCDEPLSEYYDGFDTWCDDVVRDKIVLNDFDFDGDGFLRTTDRAGFIAYAVRYIGFEDSRGQQPYKTAFEDAYGVDEAAIGAWFDEHDNDCDDEDSRIHPGALEVLGDGTDQDCDKNSDNPNDTTPFRFGTITWTDPGPPRMTSTPNAHALLVSAVGGVDQGNGVPALGPRVVALSWKVDAVAEDHPVFDDSTFSTTGSGNLHSPVGIVGSGTTYFAGASWDTPRSRLQASRSGPSSLTTALFAVLRQKASDSRPEVLTYNEADLRCDTSFCWSVACDGSSMQFMQFDHSSSVTPRSMDYDPTVKAEDCFILREDLNGGTVLLGSVLADGSVDVYEQAFGILTPAGSNPFDSLDVDWVRSRDDYLVFGLAGGGLRLFKSDATQLTVLSGETFVDADAVLVGTTWYILGLREDGSMVLAHGATGALSEVEVSVSVDGGPMTVDSVAISADVDRVILVAQGGDDVGWSILQAP